MPEIKLRYALLAERVRQVGMGQLPIEGTADTATFWGLPPYVTPSVYIVGAVAAEPPIEREHRLEIVIPDKTGADLFRAVPLPRFTLQPFGEGANLRYLGWFFALLPRIAFPSGGIYEYQVHLDGNYVGGVPLYLQAGEPPQHTGPTDLSGSASQDDSVLDALRLTRETLEKADLALTDLRNQREPRRQIAAFANVIVWGRAVTNVLQKLRSRASGFDEWYAPWQDEMKGDPLLKYLYEWRSKSLKEGATPPTVAEVDVKKVVADTPLPQAPANALSFFVGMRPGGWDG